MTRTLTVLTALLLAAAPALAQEAQKSHPGCTFTWEEPTVDDGQGGQIGAWEKEGDLDGFQMVVNDAMVWDPMKMTLIEKESRQIHCSTVGVEALGSYAVMLKAYDTSGNASVPATLAFELVEEDLDAPTPVLEICVDGTYMGKPTRFCGRVDAKPLP